jgi:hypothetical protein
MRLDENESNKRGRSMNLTMKVRLSTLSLAAIALTASAAAQTAGPVAGRNDNVIATLHAEGSQIYECKPDASKSPSEASLTWQFREPIAALFADGKSIGRHYAGPNWDHVDGSGVKAKVNTGIPGAGPSDIPWLNLDVIEHRGNGILSDAATVQRLNTRGGVAKGSCESAGSYLSVPYSADYVFRRKG